MTVRRWSVLGAAVVLAAVSGLATSTKPANAARSRVVFPIGPATTAMAITPSGTEGYFVWYGTSVLTAVNLHSHRRSAIRLSGQLSDVAVSPNGKLVYVTSFAKTVRQPSVYVIDTATNRVARTINVGTASLDVAFSPSGADAYVQIWGYLLDINVATGRVVRRIDIGNIGFGLEAVFPDGRYVYLAADPLVVGNKREPNYFEVVDVQDGRVVAWTRQESAAIACAIATTADVVYESFCDYVPGTPQSKLRVRVVNAFTGVTESRLPIVGVGLAVSTASKSLFVTTEEGPVVHVFSTVTSHEIGHFAIMTEPAVGPGSSLRSSLKYADFMQIAVIGHTLYAPSFNSLSSTANMYIDQLPAIS